MRQHLLDGKSKNRIKLSSGKIPFKRFKDMKINYCLFRDKYPGMKKVLDRMKLTTFLLLVSVISVFANNTYSQGKGFNLEIENSTVKEVLQNIEDQSEYSFVYSEKVIDVNRVVSLHVSNEKISAILDDIFKGTDVRYKIKDHYVLLTNSDVAGENFGSQETVTVTGRIIDDQGLPIPGANVVVKGTTLGVITDGDGIYVLKGVSKDATLFFSFLGMKNQEIPIDGKTTINVVMQSETIGIGEVVAVGYGTMKKSDLTGSIVQVSAEQISKSNPATVQDILRTAAPGLISSLSNKAEGGGDLTVRGTRSLAAGTDPLIVVDNVIFDGALTEINPKDIETIDVLKDASAAAVYGAKSANGVIIITTKKGKKGKPTIHVDSSVGVVTMGANRKVYGPNGFLQYRSDLFNSTNDFEDPAQYYYPSDDLLNNYGITIEDWRNYTGTSSTDDEATWLDRIGLSDEQIDNYFAGKTYDWYDASFRTGIKQDYNVSFSGAGDQMNYYFSVGYLNSEGVVVGDQYENYRSNLKLDANVTKFWEVGLNAKFSNRDSCTVATNWKRQVIYNTPYASPYDEDGNLTAYPNGETAALTGYNQAYENKYQDMSAGNTDVSTSLWSKITLPFDIQYEFRFSPRFNWYYYRYWQSSESDEDAYGGYVERETEKYYDWYLDNILRWDHTFNKHHFNVTLLQNAEEHKTWEEDMIAEDFSPSDVLEWHNVSSATTQSISSDDTHSTGDAMMARVFYSFDDRYMATLSVRRDGYSAFGSNNKRANFPSVALGWVFTKEKFFNWSPMSNGKLRLSWGKNGNRDIGIYEAMANLTDDDEGQYTYYDADGEGTTVTTLTVTTMANDNLKWEKTTSLNIGMDYGFLNNRINGTIDYYYMPTKDLLMERSLPEFTGFSSITTNLGEILNTGFELSLNSVNVDHDNFRWSSTFGFSTNKNTIKHLYNTYEDVTDEDGNVIGTTETDDSSNGWFIGKDINAIWDYKNTGIWQEDEADEAALYEEQPGDAKALDVDGDYSFTTSDKVFMGSTSPKFRWSLRNDFQILKNLNLSVNIYSYWGQKEATTEYLNNNGEKTLKTNAYVSKYWTPDNPSNRYARLNSTLPSDISPKLVMDKSFIRLDNISLSYTLPSRFTEKIAAQNVMVYGSVQNVAVWTKEWEYWDPEITGPVPRTFTVGASLTF